MTKVARFLIGQNSWQIYKKGGENIMSKLYDLLWKKSEEKGKAKWERVGIMLEKENGKRSVKLDLVPAGEWDGWLVVSEKKSKEAPY